MVLTSSEDLVLTKQRDIPSQEKGATILSPDS